MAQFLPSCVYLVVVSYVHFECGIAMASSEPVDRGGKSDGKPAETLHRTYWGFNPLLLLDEQQVRDELAVSPDQARKLDLLLHGYLEAIREIVLEVKRPKAMPRDQRRLVATTG